MEGGTRAGLSVEEHFEELVKELTANEAILKSLDPCDENIEISVELGLRNIALEREIAILTTTLTTDAPSPSPSPSGVGSPAPELPPRTVSGAAPAAANQLRIQHHADVTRNELAEMCGSAERTHLSNTHFDFALPSGFEAPQFHLLHRDNLVGHDVAELKATRILDLFDSLRGVVLVPLGTDADGDCLLHAAAIGMWGVHWERSGRDSGKKAAPDTPNLFSTDESPMRTSMYKCRKRHEKHIFLAWTAEYLSRLEWQHRRNPETLCEEEVLVRRAITFACPPHERNPDECVTFHRHRSASAHDYTTAVKYLGAKYREDASMFEAMPTDDDTLFFNRFLGAVHIAFLAMVLRRPVIVYSNSAISTAIEGFAGIYIPWLLPLEQWATNRPLLLHGGRQHFTALVTVEGASTRIPLFVGEPDDLETRGDSGEHIIHSTPLPVRFCNFGRPSWRGFNASWHEDPAGRAVIARYIGRIVTDKVGATDRHFLDLNEYEKHEPLALARTIADAFFAKLKRQHDRLQQSKRQLETSADERAAHEYWDELSELDQALLMSMDYAADTHSQHDLESWLCTHGEAARQSYKIATLSPIPGSPMLSPFSRSATPNLDVPQGSAGLKRRRIEAEEGLPTANDSKDSPSMAGSPSTSMSTATS